MSSSILDRSVVPGAGPLRPFSFPAIERFTLGSGLPVVYSRTSTLPVATYSLLLPAGAVRERSDQAGLATLTGSLLESGTRVLSAAEIANRLETLGVRVRVGTAWEVSHIDFTVLPDRAAAAADVVADLVREPSFPEAEVDRLRNQQLAAILQRRAEPRGLANEMVARSIFSAETPFSRPLAGTTATVGSLSRDDAVAFHAGAFTPHSATLVVAGNLSLEEVRRSAEGAFGGWTGDQSLGQTTTVEPRSDAVRIIIVERPGAVQSEIRVGHVGVPRNTPDYFAIRVMNTILGGAFSSRLNLNLREKHGYTYGVRSSFVMRRSPGPFIVSTAVQTEVTVDAIREIIAELHRIRDEDISSAELADARQYVAGTFPLHLETTDGVASRLAELVINDLPDRYLEEFAQRILAVSADDVTQAARRHIHPDRLTILVVGDPEVIRPRLDELGLGSVQVLSPEAD